MKIKIIFCSLISSLLLGMSKKSCPPKELIGLPTSPQAPKLPLLNVNGQEVPKSSKIKDFLQQQYCTYTHEYHRYILAWQKYQTALKAYNPELIPTPMQSRKYYPWEAPSESKT